MKQFDVTALGELLIDFTENGLSNQGNYLLEANPGGAVCNVLAMLRKLGKKTAFIGKVGNDYLGRHLKKVVEEVNGMKYGIRKFLGDRVRHQLRIIPELQFFEDDSLDYIENIDHLLKD